MASSGVTSALSEGNEESERKEKGRAIVEITPELVLLALAFPEDTKTLYVRWDPERHVLRFVMESFDLPEWVLGNPLPVVRPILTYDYDNRPATWMEFDWNLKNEP